MKPEYAVELGDVIEVLKNYQDNSFDAVLCDPPYGLSFMGKKWDYDVPSAALWREVLRVCKPGAALIAFSGTRTYHRTVVQIEDAGFEIRDQLAWMYASGFPKSLDVSKAIDKAAGAEREVVGFNPKVNVYADGKNHKFYVEGEGNPAYGPSPITAPATDAARLWHGYGTALKPALEPAVLARKPLEGTVAENVEKWGVGALAIDASRIEGGKRSPGYANPGTKRELGGTWNSENCGFDGTRKNCDETQGRWPANVILDEEAGALLDEQSGNRPGMSGGGKHKADYEGGMFGGIDGNANHARNDNGGASRFFYCAKANKKERGEGNNHPTVKPIALMEYLARLIMPPKPGAILVPFAGSGSEMMGALKAGWPAVLGIEREFDYVEIAKGRLDHAFKAA